MSDNLTTSDKPEQEPEVVVEFTTREDYISSCFYALSSIECVDTDIMPEAGKQRIKRMRKRCLTILDDLVKEMYDELYNTEENEQL